MIRFLLLLYLLISAPLFAQDLRVVEDVKPTLNYFEDKVDDAVARGKGVGITTYIDSIPAYLSGKTVSGGKLKDRHGRIWDMGNLKLPYLLHTLHGNSKHNLDALSEIAKSNEGELLVFLMVRHPQYPKEVERIKSLDERVIVVHNERIYHPMQRTLDNQLMGLIGYPVTYYVRADRTIDHVYHGWVVPPGRQGEYPAKAVVAYEKNLKRINDSVRQLLGK